MPEGLGRSKAAYFLLQSSFLSVGLNYQRCSHHTDLLYFPPLRVISEVTSQGSKGTMERWMRQVYSFDTIQVLRWDVNEMQTH